MMLKFPATSQGVSCSTVSVFGHLERARPEQAGSQGAGGVLGAKGFPWQEVSRGRRGPGAGGVPWSGHRGQLGAGHCPALPEPLQPHLGLSAPGDAGC